MPDVTISVFANGPYKVVGPVTILDDDDQPISIPADERVFLCRCGQSGDKPFCDGTHKTCGFVDAGKYIPAG